MQRESVDLPSPLGRELDQRDIDFISRVSQWVVPTWVLDREEAFGCGQLGYWKAALAFDHKQSVPWPSYAHIRVRGAVLDGARAWDWLGRKHRRDIQQGRTVATDATARPMSIDSMSLAHGEIVGYDALDRLLWKADECHLSGHEANETRLTVEDAVAQIEPKNPRAHATLTMIFHGEMTYADIAEFYGVTVSRIYQLRAEGLGLLAELLPQDLFLAA